MTIKFIEEANDPNKGFRIGGEQSLFQNNVTFTVTGYKLGNYQITKDDGTVESTKYASEAQQIMLVCDLGGGVTEELPINRLLKKRVLCYDKHDTAKVIEVCRFKAELTRHVEAIGRREDNSAYLKSSVEEVAKHAVKFFDGKKIQCHEEADCFAHDSEGKLVARTSPVIVFDFFK